MHFIADISAKSPPKCWSDSVRMLASKVTCLRLARWFIEASLLIYWAGKWLSLIYGFSAGTRLSTQTKCRTVYSRWKLQLTNIENTTPRNGRKLRPFVCGSRRFLPEFDYVTSFPRTPLKLLSNFQNDISVIFRFSVCYILNPNDICLLVR